VPEVPDAIEDLLRRRQEARKSKDFATADRIRDEILAQGYVLRDTPAGLEVLPVPRYETIEAGAIASTLDQPPTCDFTFNVLYERYPHDLERFLAGLRAHRGSWDVEVIIVDNASPDGEHLDLMADEDVRVIHLAREVGWAEARNAGLKISRGRLIALVDLSLEPTGDILSPLATALEDPAAGVVGPFGLRSQDMREWEPSDGPEVDAIEGYLLVAKREALARGLLNEKFKWYRNADIDLSFQIRHLGLAAQVVPLPVRKHAHRGWEELAEPERTRRSKKNHYIFFDRWKRHHAMLLSHREE
jgi:cysteinyl-tRNA synthetase